MDDDGAVGVDRGRKAPPSHPIRNTVLQWAGVWFVLGLSCMGGKGTGDVMTIGDFGPVVMLFSTLTGALFGLLYALARRRWPAPSGWRRDPGAAHSWRTRLAALGYGALIGALIVGLPARSWAVGLLFALMMGITAFIVPGDADLPR